MEASGAGGFEPWAGPKIRALAAAWFHRVTKVNQSAWNFSMLPRWGRTMDMEKHRGGGGRARERKERQRNKEQGKAREQETWAGGQEVEGGGRGYGDT